MGMIDISRFQNIHRGIPAAILGGGPSLPGDLKRLPKDAILISVNHHGLKLVEAEYMAFLDRHGLDAELDVAVETFNGFRVSQQKETDIDLSSAQWWNCGFSAGLATWFACWCGCLPVLLCGMDCYQGEKKYFYERPEHRDPAFEFPLGYHLRAWRGAFEHCPNPEWIKAMSGPLGEVFGYYE
jgi:hypothetical protein